MSAQRDLARNRRSHAWKLVLTVLVLGVVSGGALALAWLWIFDGGITSISGTAAFFTSLGRITGLFAGYLLVLQVLLLIRLPFLEWISGFDQLTRWHRLVGKSCLYLIIGHVVAITIGYAITGRSSVFREFALLVANYYGMIAALIGTVMVILIALSSFVIIRKRLPYETWYAVHVLAYVGITLSWFHETRTGLDFIKNPWAGTFWLGIYLLTLQLLLVFRLAQPVARHYFHRLRVVEVKAEGPGVTSVRISGRHLDWLDAQAGQFFLWRFLTPKLRWQAHPFSLSAAPDGNSVRITAKALGDFSAAMATIKPGTSVATEGPFGSLIASTRTHHGVLLIAGGIGITPLRALVETMSGEITLLYRVMTEADLVFKDELDELAGTGNLTIHYVVGDHRQPENDTLMSPKHLLQLVPDIKQRDVYVSGPPAMVRMIQTSLRAAAVPRMHIHTEEFALG